jgi:translation initiation factor IF-2
LQRQLIQLPVPPIVAAKVKHRAKLDRKPVKKKGSGKVVADKKEVKAVIETKEPVKEPVKRRRSGCSEEKKHSKEETPAEEAITTQYQNCRELN